MATTQQTVQITFGDTVECMAADGKARRLRALSGVVSGGDFAVVRVCTEREWDAAARDARSPDGIAWPAEDVRPAKEADVGT